MPDAVIFDFDGVIVDTEPLHHRAFCAVLEPYGLACSWEDYLDRFVGLDDRDALKEFFRGTPGGLDPPLMAKLIAAKAGVFARLAEGAVVPYPGVIKLIRHLEGRLPLALCTGALPSDVAPILTGLGLNHAFRVVVTAADVDAGKPDPSGYRQALAGLRREYPGRVIRQGATIAIEDTPAGIRAARGAGLPVLAVTNNFPPEDLREADRVIDSLAEVTFAELAVLVQEGL